MPDKRRILITGVSRFLGLRLAKALESEDRVGALVGVDLEEPPIDVKGLEFVRVDIRNPLIARVLEATRVDTIVHTNIMSAPGRFGGRLQMKENNVIGTMQLLAAAQRAGRVSKVVMKSSPAVYGYGPGQPSIIPEDHAARPMDLSGYARDCADAETYARDFGRRRPDVDLLILRIQTVIGATVSTSMTDYLALPVVPTILGYDPRLQFLHEEDAVAALRQAALEDVSGIFNVAADGALYLSKAIRLLGRVQAPMILPAARPVAMLLRGLNLIDFPMDQLKLLTHGRVVDTRRAKEMLGFDPRFTSEEALLDYRDHRDGDSPAEQSWHPAWERELFEYLRRKAESSRQTV
jgi:UDP-glucose 4-epimerase